MAGTGSSASILKQEGNNHFRKGDWGAAVRLYTDAIVRAGMPAESVQTRHHASTPPAPRQTLDGSMSVLYSNRGMAHKKLENFEAVLSDAKEAVRLDSENMRGHYLLGVARCTLAGEDLDMMQRGLEALAEARRLADRKGCSKALLQDFARAQALHAKRRWRLALHAERLREAQYMSLLTSLLPAPALTDAAGGCASPSASGVSAATAVPSEAVAQPAAAPSGSSPVVAPEQAELVKGMLAHFEAREAARAAEEAAERDGAVPSFVTCGITMEPMLDPVVSPASGLSFERSAVERWLTQGKMEDPITRQPLTLAGLRPNVGLKGAIEAYLEDHPWAHPTSE